MSMKTRFKYFVTVLLSVIGTACQPHADYSVEYGTSISFLSTTEYVNGTETRTSYSGVINSGGIERIDWVSGDKIRIASPDAHHSQDPNLHYADYTINGHTPGTDADSYKSYATVVPDDADALLWGNDSHTFYGIYPSPATAGMGSFISLDAPSSGSAWTSTITLPSHQNYSYTTVTAGSVEKKILQPDMDYAYMYASVQADPTASVVELAFKPMFTAFEFTIRTDDSISGHDEVFVIKSFTMSAAGVPLTGSCVAHLPASTLNGEATFDGFTSTPSEDNKKITVTFNGTEGYAITRDNPLTFTVFALPRNYGTNDNDGLTISFTTAYGKTKTMELKSRSGSWLPFYACCKHRIIGLGIPNDDWTYTMSELAPLTLTYQGAPTTPAAWKTDFRSYRSHLDGTTEEAVPYKIQYSLDEGETWTDEAPAWITPVSATSFSGSGGDETAGENLTMNMAAQTNNNDMDAHTNHLRGKSTVTRDLSLFNGKGEAVSRTTANCYIVRDPGTYTFPLVYGNAILNGAVNEAAFHRTYSTSEIEAALAASYGGAITDITAANFLEYFVDHNGDPITNTGAAGLNYTANSIYIAERFSGHTLGVKLIWEDADGIITSPSITGSGTAAAIRFTVPKASIQEGNALLAVTVDDVIAWSWHIWISDEDYSSEAYQTFEAQNGYRFAPDNIGWVNGKKLFFPGRSCLVRAVQLPPSGTGMMSGEVAVTQTEHLYFDPLGNSSYFQWGRKDPLPGSNGDPVSSEKKTIYNNDSSYPSGAVARQATGLSEAITHPNTHFAGANNDWCATSYLNLWNSSAFKPYTYNEISQVKDNTPTKTIYDPSPGGFMVPPVSAYDGFVSSDFTFEENLVNLPDGYPQGYFLDEDRFFPVTGYVDRQDITSGSDYIVHGIHTPELYYWSSTPAAKVGTPVTSYQCAYEFVLRYTQSAQETEKTVKFSSSNSYTKTIGTSIRPVEETVPTTRIYVLEDDGLYMGWGSARRLFIDKGTRQALTASGTATYGSYTYSYFDIPTSLLGTADVSYGDNGGQEMTLASQLYVALGRNYYFRLNDLETVRVTDPGTPEPYTKIRLYVLETVSTALHPEWNTSYARTLNVSGGASGVPCLGEETFGSYTYKYFDIDVSGISGSTTSVDYLANGVTLAQLSSVTINPRGRVFFRVGSKEAIVATTDTPSDPASLRAVVYVKDETAASSVYAYWGDATSAHRTLQINDTSPYLSVAGTETYGSYDYLYFQIPTNKSGEYYYYRGENGLRIALGITTPVTEAADLIYDATTVIEPNQEYFFKTNGYERAQIAAPTNPDASTYTARTRIYVHSDINTTLRPDWGRRTVRVRPVGGTTGGWRARIGTATLGGLYYYYFDVPYHGGSHTLYYGQGALDSYPHMTTTDVIDFTVGGEHFFRTNGLQILDITANGGTFDSPAPYTLSRIYVQEDINTSHHVEWGNAGYTRQIELGGTSILKSGTTTMQDKPANPTVTESYIYFDITNLSSLTSTSSLLYNCYDAGTGSVVTNNGHPLKVTFSQSSDAIKQGGEFFYRIDGKKGVTVTNALNPDANKLPSRIYLLGVDAINVSAGHLEAWGAYSGNRYLKGDGISGNIVYSSSEYIEDGSGTPQKYYYFNITNASSLTAAADLYFNNGASSESDYCECKIAGAAIQGGDVELFYRTDGIRLEPVNGDNDPRGTITTLADPEPRFWVASPSTRICIMPYSSTDAELFDWDDLGVSIISTRYDSKYKGGYWYYDTINPSAGKIQISNQYWDPDYYWYTDFITFGSTSESHYYYIDEVDEFQGGVLKDDYYEKVSVPYSVLAP